MFNSHHGHRISTFDKGLDTVKHGAFKFEDFAQLVKPNASWEDLTLPQTELSKLKSICDRVKQNNQILSERNSDQKPLYRKGVHVLFSGPTGSGKTFTAVALANEAELILFRIDLGQLVSKYVGETEENLNDMFDRAAEMDGILFFDEADALFGNRNEVSDSHDQCANNEVGYLLSKIEKFEGTCLLSSNQRLIKDKAFVRRMEFVVEFPPPEKRK